jgi:hypothetical protein
MGRDTGNHLIINALIYLLIAMVTAIGTDAFHFYTGHYIVEPLFKAITRPKLEVETSPFPNLHDGKEWTKVNLNNKGLKDIEGIRVRYEDFCSNKSSIAPLGLSTLDGGKTASFEYETERNTNCSAVAQLPTLTVYRDSLGRFYCDENETTSNVCVYCPLNVKVFSGYDLIKDVNFSMPFSVSDLTARIGSEECIPLSKAKDPSRLEVFSRTPEGAIFDTSSMCLTGQLSADWCRQYSFIEGYVK